MSRKPYVRAVGREWLTRHPRYLRYMLRELSCLFIGGWTLMLVWGLARLAQGPEAWEAFLQALRSPASIALQLGEEFVADRVISGAHFAVWAALSLAVLLLAGAF